MKSQLTVDEIQEQIRDVFTKYKIKPLAGQLPARQLINWANAHSKRLGRDVDQFRKRTTAIYWSVAGVQLQLGYLLVIRESIGDIRTKKGVVYERQSFPQFYGMEELHFWHHDYLLIECFYRCWERFAKLLQLACYPNNEEKLYFDELITRLGRDASHSNNPYLKDLKSCIKDWNKIAGLRNDVSHDDSSPLKNLEMEGKESDIRDMWGRPILKVEYATCDIFNEIKRVEGYYLRLEFVIKAVLGFINNIH